MGPSDAFHRIGDAGYLQNSTISLTVSINASITQYSFRTNYARLKVRPFSPGASFAVAGKGLALRGLLCILVNADESLVQVEWGRRHGHVLIPVRRL